MITIVYSFWHVYGVEVWLAFFLVCVLFYLSVCCLFRRNRTKRGIQTVLLGLLAAEILCDAAWASAFYPGGEYHDYGLGGSYMLLFIWPSLLVLVGIAVTCLNTAQVK